MVIVLGTRDSLHLGLWFVCCLKAENCNNMVMISNCLFVTVGFRYDGLNDSGDQK